MKDLDITRELGDILNYDGFLFNPSIAHVIDNVYLVSVRTFKYSNGPMDPNPILKKNKQHPWGMGWKGKSITSIVLMDIKNNVAKSIDQQQLDLSGQDTRIFRFMEDNTHITYILTFNQSYKRSDNIVIKGGDKCDDYCYIIGWGYLLVDKKNFKMTYVPGDKPLCTNISEQIEKNWSIWRYDCNSKIYLMNSYSLTPTFNVFSFNLIEIDDGDILASEQCSIMTPRDIYPNIFVELEQYYDGLFVSLSTPSYLVGNGIYQSVGHLKILKGTNPPKGTPLARYFKHFKGGKKQFHDKFVYLMFIYRYKIEKVETKTIQTNNHRYKQVKNVMRMLMTITDVSPAFSIKVGDYDYFLNFPAGMVVDNDKTIISYGDGDASSHLLTITNEEIEKMFAFNTLSAKDFKFIHGEKELDGDITFEIPLDGLLNLPVKSVKYFAPDTTAGGIYVFTTANGQYVIKPENNIDGHITATKIAKMLGINTPKLERINFDDIPENQKLKLKGKKFSKVKNPEYLFMEYLPNVKPVKDSKIPKKYCNDAYIQVGKIMAFDLFVWNFDRYYFIEFEECSDDVNTGNLLYSKDTHKIYAIDHEVHKHTKKYNTNIYNDLFSGPPYSPETINVVKCALKGMGNRSCKDDKLILYSAEETVKLIREKYSKIKKIWPDAPELPSLK